MKTDIHASQDAAVADLVGAGQVRIGMFPPHYIKNVTTGELKGWGVDLALALAARIGVEARPVEYPGPDKLLEGLNADACDAGFLVNSPVWANAVDYSQPFLQQDFTFLLPPGSSIRSIADVDRPEVRIAVVRHHASNSRIGAHPQAGQNGQQRYFARRVRVTARRPDQRVCLHPTATARGFRKAPRFGRAGGPLRGRVLGNGGHEGPVGAACLHQRVSPSCESVGIGAAGIRSCRLAWSPRDLSVRDHQIEY